MAQLVNKIGGDYNLTTGSYGIALGYRNNANYFNEGAEYNTAIGWSTPKISRYEIKNDTIHLKNDYKTVASISVEDFKKIMLEIIM